MALFQHSVLTKYQNTQDKKVIAEKWSIYKNHFLSSGIQENIRNSKEEEYQGEFLIDLFVNVLGYTKKPNINFNLTTELKNEKDSKKADGAIIINNGLQTIVIAVIELKGTNTTDFQKIEIQAFGYKNNQKDCVYVITSNFEKLRFYIDNAIDYVEFNLFTLTEKQFELLYLCLAFENISKGIPKKLKEESLSQEDLITKQLYKEYSNFKSELYQNLTQLNPQFDALELFKKSQKLLDRFLFLFFAEDRQLLPPNSVRLILDQWKQLKSLDEYVPLYGRFKKYFGYLNTGFKGERYDVFAYNGGLFKPDEILDTIKVDDQLLYNHTSKLSDYDFASEVDVNILGHIFENSLNELDEIKARLEGVDIDKSTTKRKKDGVYYTPKYITKYIVENTIGKLCTEKKEELQIVEEAYFSDKKQLQKTKQILLTKLKTYREWLLQITICDPACGSGAFLNQALDFLINEHHYIDELESKLLGGGLVFSNIETSILENNLFGVDINEESVEIAKLSLWLRTAQPNRKLNDLNNNIKCGNSLVDDPSIAGEKAFNWHKEFPQVFELKDKKIWHVTWVTHDTRTSQRMIDYRVREPKQKGEIHVNRPYYFNDSESIIITKILHDIIIESKYNCLEYNVCSDHIHILLVCSEEDLPNIVRKLKGKSTQKFKEYLQLDKTETFNLWAQKFDRNYITNEQELQTKINYIRTNREKHHLPDINKGLQPLVRKITNDVKQNSQPHNEGMNPDDINKGLQPLVREMSSEIKQDIQPNNEAMYLSYINKGLQPLVENMTTDIKTAFRPEYRGGFDVVIGNPPYVGIRENKQYFEKKYTLTNSGDLYSLFYEKGCDLLKKNGYLGLITPSSLFTNIGFTIVRKFLIYNYEIKSILDLGSNVFSDASVDSGIVILKNIKSDNYTILCSKNDFKFTELEKNYFLKFDNTIFNIYSNEIEFDLTLKLDSNCSKLNDFVYFARGVEFGFKSEFVFNSKNNTDLKPLICGGNINRYRISFEEKYIYFDFKNQSIYKSIDIYETEKILVRRIGNQIISVYDNMNFINVCDVYNLLIKDVENDSLKYILVLLNSKLLTYYYNVKFKSVKILFPKIPIQNLKQLPIPKIPLSAQQPFIDRADLMLTLNKELQDVSGKFLRNIQREFKFDELSKKLQNWYSITYSEFLKEIDKKKVKLSLSQKSEWEDYFNFESKKAADIQNKINQTDNEIDKMVYELYGLTDDEIITIESYNSIQ